MSIERMAMAVAPIAAHAMVIVCLLAAYGTIGQVAALGGTNSIAVQAIMVLAACGVTALMYRLLGCVRTLRWVWRVLEGWTTYALAWGVTALAWPKQYANPEQAEFDRFATPWLLTVWIVTCGVVLMSLRLGARDAAPGGSGTGA